MSIEITNETKSVEIIKEQRTWRLEIFTPKNTNYQIVIHREEVETIDGVAKEGVKLPSKSVSVSEILASTEDLAYTDTNGNAKTIAIKDIPILIAKWADDKYTEVPEEV